MKTTSRRKPEPRNIPGYLTTSQLISTLGVSKSLLYTRVRHLEGFPVGVHILGGKNNSPLVYPEAAVLAFKQKHFPAQ